MKNWKVSVGLSVLVALAACQKPSSGENAVKVLDAGADPRQALRYKFQAGKQDTMILDLKLAMSMEMGTFKQPEVKIPVLRQLMTIKSKDISPEGNLRYEFELTEAQVLPDPEALPQVVTAMEEEIKKLAGISGFAVVSPRGVVLDADLKVPENASQQMQQIANEMRQQIRQLSAPLPEEPVGKGARWQVDMPITTPAMTLSQMATYTLDDLNGNVCQLTLAIVQSAPAQKIQAPGLPADADVRLNFLKSSGSGGMKLNLAELVPTSEMTMSTSMEMTISQGGQKQDLTTNLNVQTKIFPKTD